MIARVRVAGVVGAAAVMAWGPGAAGAPAETPASNWFVVQPSVQKPDGAFPLVSVHRSVITACGRSCVRAVRKGAHVRPVGVDGALRAAIAVTGALRYDTEPFDEIQLKVSPPTELLVSDGFTPRPTTMFTPTGDVQRALEKFVRSVDELTIDQSVKLKGSLKRLPRTTAFRFTAGGRERVVAVVDGPALAIATLNARGQWVLQHLEQAALVTDSVDAEAFHVLAVVDMDGDGVPEIVALEQIEESWWHLVYRYDRDGDGTWSIVARRPGSTV
ncbi:MAG TPA: hypothetical protein VN903_07955 [Polyangia bacterium]|jgi:hypothetical protein|nr:hypothetical protein [Polyangia bacterium]